MSDPKTTPNDASVTGFLRAVAHPQRRADSFQLLELLKEITGEQPQMWGSSIVGFGSYHYQYASGREGDWPIVGFSPRKQNLTLYIMNGFDRYESLLARLGKHKTGKSCLYLNKLEDVDLQLLRELIQESVAYMKNKYPHS